MDYKRTWAGSKTYSSIPSRLPLLKIFASKALNVRVVLLKSAIAFVREVFQNQIHLDGLLRYAVQP